MVAAENGALPGGKVGGVGDVIRDLPIALAARGWHATVITPAYGSFNRLPGAVNTATVELPFAGARQHASIWHIPAHHSAVEHLVIEHPAMAPDGPGKIYCHDPADRPFATDASKFAFFCAALAAYVKQCSGSYDVVHLHDWHAGFYLLLRAYDPQVAALKSIRTVFTIHNLALQGIRPFAGDTSSLASWFPDLAVPLGKIVDPRYADCINPMLTAIRLADKISTVSPTYAQEILRPSDPAHGFSGGEGLETDLQQASREGRLAGILNGCEYSGFVRRPVGWQRLLDAMDATLAGWQDQELATIAAVSAATLKALPRRRPKHVLVSVGRLAAQKAALFMQLTKNDRSALETILDELGNSGVFIMLGSGNRALEDFFSEIALQRKNFLFLCGYSDLLADMLYAAGDLFLMPSTFEPCGISQMLAMRAGQPCVVHAVGGLKDTIENDVDGFEFAGDTPLLQADNFASSVKRALQLKSADPAAWKVLREHAASRRFSWSVAAERYEQELYVCANR